MSASRQELAVTAREGWLTLAAGILILLLSPVHHPPIYGL
jgi:hypothetical protein